ncbi:hypothetical protein EMO89_01520 [Bifidobacterium tissieri]|uniref:Uncharacterized protein n=1 Tax=Bifidobacterium tissieri TaxID=1630162 RepID=A0A5M9ZVY2_9BIFI|nr:hypothetical protein [Bifidobacterium tissieri]KAA8831443.1 hypothetical protein EMO89_01520 [Bifidobacterium tissieri]
MSAPTRTWTRLFAHQGTVITRVDDVAPGDVVFLQADGRLVAFEVIRVARDISRILLFQSSARWYQIRGGSRVRFEYALRGENPDKE